MELQAILDGIGDPKKLVDDIKKTKGAFDYSTIKSQLDTKQHPILIDKTKYQDKDGPEQGTKIPIARLVVPFQKQIVSRAAAFLCGNPIELDVNPEDGQETDFVAMIRRTWDDNKLDYESKKMAKFMMGETEVAELWYMEEAEEGYWLNTANKAAKLRLRVKILANKFGDSLYPIFNSVGDMVAFARGYETMGEKDKKITHLDVYTPETTYKLSDETGSYVVLKEDNPAKKIPVIYYSQEQPEWQDVQEMIERIEELISKHADTNDYFGDPTLILEAASEDDVTWAQKNDRGKAAILKNGAKATYLYWPLSPESVKMEYLNLRSLIMDMTDTPDISFDQVKGIGNYSGVALRMLFLAAHMKAADKEEEFGKGVQRRINFLKAAMAVINTSFEKVVQLSIKPRFKFFLPKNELEMVQMLTTAVSGEKPILSQETAVEQNTLVEDKQAEKDKLTAQQASDQQNNSDQLGNQFKVA